MNSRERFEADISGPPYELSTERFPAHSSWPGNYRDYRVQLAWDIWQAAEAGAAKRCAEICRDVANGTEPEEFALDAANACASQIEIEFGLKD